MTNTQGIIWKDAIRKWRDQQAVQTAEKLRGLATIPAESEAFNIWLEQHDTLKFLVDNAHEEWLVIYCATQHAFIHGVLVPSSALNPLATDDLLKWNGNAYGGWGVSVSKSKVWIEAPLQGFASKIIGQGEQLVFVRDFADVDEHPPYVELLQKLLHVCEIHFIEELGAWCKLEHGKEKPVVYVAFDKGKCIVLMHRDILAIYASLAQSVLVRMFDFPRYNPQNFIGWHDITSKTPPAKDSIYYIQALLHGYASYNRGVQLTDIATPNKDIVKKILPNIHSEDSKYETFTTLDWKNRCIAEVSCAPDATANYFVNNDLPFELSPVFFDQEVLLRYKSGGKKYKVTDNEISCRGAWGLAYDINAGGQVFVYLCDLRKIPYKEQSYWKVFNENPVVTNFNQKPLQILKSTLSATAFKAHFLGSWEISLGSLQSLKSLLLELQCPWWKLSSRDVLTRIGYPVADSEKDWKDEIIALHQILIENLQQPWLQKKAEKLGCKVDKSWRSLKLLEQCLIHSDVHEDRAKQIVSSLRQLHELRNKTSHQEGADILALRKQAIKEHGNYYKHYVHLVDTCCAAFQTLADTLR